MSIGGLSSRIYDWAMVLTVIGVVVLITYAIFATIVFLVLSSRVGSNKTMDKLAKFTGQDAVVTNKGVVQVVRRLMVTIILSSFLLSGGGFLLIKIIYSIFTRFYYGVMG